MRKKITGRGFQDYNFIFFKVQIKIIKLKGFWKKGWVHLTHCKYFIDLYTFSSIF